MLGDKRLRSNGGLKGRYVLALAFVASCLTFVRKTELSELSTPELRPCLMAKWALSWAVT